MERFTIHPKIIHRNPDIITYENLLSSDECRTLIRQATPHLKKSMVKMQVSELPFDLPILNEEAGESKMIEVIDHSFRTSQSAETPLFSDLSMIKMVMDRCSTLCGLPSHFVEPPQIVRYSPGEYFKHHMDNLFPNGDNFKIAGQRLYTFFIYLNEPNDSETGGETEFKNIGLKVKPKRGMGVLWRNVNLETREDDLQVRHAGLPPDNWIKWGMNVWVRQAKTDILFENCIN
jgi:prolyl 4-hydroxylase